MRPIVWCWLLMVAVGCQIGRPLAQYVERGADSGVIELSDQGINDWTEAERLMEDHFPEGYVVVYHGSHVEPQNALDYILYGLSGIQFDPFDDDEDSVKVQPSGDAKFDASQKIARQLEAHQQKEQERLKSGKSDNDEASRYQKMPHYYIAYRRKKPGERGYVHPVFAPDEGVYELRDPSSLVNGTTSSSDEKP